jgi:hypothetical protein
MLSVPTPNFNYIIPADKYAMPRNGGTTIDCVVDKPLLIDSKLLFKVVKGQRGASVMAA